MPDFEQTLNHLLSNPAVMEQVAQLAQSLNTPSAVPPQTVPQAPPDFPLGTQNVPSDAPDMLSDVPGNHAAAPSPEELPASPGGSQTFIQLLPLLRELSGQQDSNARRLLYALRPYLNPRRQEKMERALQLAKVCHIGKKFLLEWWNQDV